MSSIYSSVVEACRILDVQTVPEVYVRQNPVPNVRRCCGHRQADRISSMTRGRQADR